MGCYAAINALRFARHIVRSEPDAKVLVVSLELCSLHLQETSDLEQVLSFLIFADGSAAALVSAEPRGLSIDRSTSVLAPEAPDQITWQIGRSGFDMQLSGHVSSTIAASLPKQLPEILTGARRRRSSTGPSTPAAAASSTRSRAPSLSRRTSSPLHATCSAATATCPRRPCCSCSRRCWRVGSAAQVAPSHSAPVSRREPDVRGLRVIDLKRRSTEPELMDVEASDPPPSRLPA